MMDYPVVKGVSLILAHTPDLVKYGSKPTREIPRDEELLKKLEGRLRPFEEAKEYPPNQVFIGNMSPEELWEIEKPWHSNLSKGAPRVSPWGEIFPQEEFYGWLKIVDEFDLISLSNAFTKEIKEVLARHPFYEESDGDRLGEGASQERLEEEIRKGAMALESKGQLVGIIKDGHDEDENLTAHILLENLSCKVTGVLALRSLVKSSGVDPESIAFVLNCGEEGVGDRYQRGAGNLAKAMAELSFLSKSTGADIKAFCCGPMHTMVLASGLVQSGIFDKVVLVGGGCMAKLGMKMHGHLSHSMPILEDTMAGMAVLIEKNDGKSPMIRTDLVGVHDIVAGSSQQAIMEALVLKPLQGMGLTILDVDKYASELHNPEITEPAGSGNVPRNNYRMIGSLAVMEGLMEAKDLDGFEKKHGMPGFSPTQGHIPSALPYMGFALSGIMDGSLERVMFLGKGSLFLAKMTKLSDGMSFVLEKNRG